MSDFRNSEGYPDPTPYKAVRGSRISFMPLVYICSPLAGDVDGSMEMAKRCSRFALDQGRIPLAPQLMFSRFMDGAEPEERELELFMDIVLLGKCSELWVFGEIITEGMYTVMEVAKRRRQPVRYFRSDLQEVAGK